VTASDDFSSNLQVDFEESTEDADCGYVITRTWSTADACGNPVTASQVITVEDTTAPELIGVPANYSAQCGEIPAVADVTASDNCDEEMMVVFNQTQEGEGCQFTITRTWTVSDDCGNTTSQFQLIVIHDTTAPSVTFVAENETIECTDEIPAVVDAQFTDNCDENLNVVFASENVTLDCGYQIQRTWTATDDCGNVTVAQQNIDVVDTTAPVIAPYTYYLGINCDEVDSYIGITATDNCGEVHITYVDQLNSGGCLGTLYRVYTVTDDCGNTATAEQFISVIDNQGPVINNPADAIVECTEAPTEMPTIEIYDACGYEVTVTEASQTIVEIDACSYQIVWHWVAIDYCDNVSEATTVITVTDLTAPVFANVAPEATFECSAEYVAPSAPTASDNCDDMLDWTSDVATVNGTCAANYDLVYTWTVTDNCGNTTVAQTIHHIVDTTAPVWVDGTPAELTFECTDVVAGIEPMAMDNCSDFTVAVAETLFVAGPCYTSGAYIYTATDACGNVSVPFYQYFEIHDTQAPVITGQYEINLPCDDNQGVFVTYTDNCQEVNISYTDELVSGGCAGRIIRTYVANDGCGNESSFQQFITLIDTTAPVAIYIPENIQVECGQGYEMPSAIFSDNCDEEFEMTSSMNTTGDACATLITYTWTAIDHCQNITSVSATVTILDTTNPTWEYVPADVAVSCDETIPAAEMATAIDNCDNDVEVSMIEEIIDGDCPSNYTIRRIYRAFDDCGNQAMAIQNVVVSDQTAPVWADGTTTQLTFDCADIIAGVEPMAMDNCSDWTIAVAETLYVQGPCYTSGAFIFTATDACGNVSAPFYQYYTIVDTTAPIVDGIVEIERPCTDYMGTYITATDNCNTFDIEFVDEFVSGGCQGRIIRDYTVTDFCGNASSFQQIITLTDEIAPVAEVLAENMTIECTEEVPSFIPSWSDNCDDELELTAISSIAVDGCTEYISRSWTATDNCGNSTTISQMITIVDTEAPMFDGDGYSMTVNCDEDWSVETPSAWDACNDVTVAEEVETIAGNCEASYTEVHTFVATDECGNESAPFIVSVNVVDNTAPYWTYVPSSNEISCDAEVPSMMATASDACSEVTVTSSVEIIEGNCPSAYTLVRTFYAEDACGNEAEPVSVSYYIYDNVAPVIETELVDIYVECPIEIVPVEIAVSDNCSEVSVDPSVEQVTSDDCGNGQWIVSYHVVDACGNYTTASYSVYVNDVTAPEMINCPEDMVIDCDAELPEVANVMAFDNCNGEVEVMYEQFYIGEQPEEGSIADCNLMTPALPAGNPCGYSTSWAMALFNLPSMYRYYQVQEAELVQFENGSAHLTGSLVSATNSNAGFDINVWFNNRKDWATWSTQSFPTGFKADCGGEAANHQDWFYYLLVNGSGAELNGWGDFEGSAINLSHAPSNNYFGFQLGDGANNYNNADNAFGGWFTYSGTFVLPNQTSISTVSGAGDFAFELDCCPDYSVVRCWTAFDCSGNEVSHCQTITFAGSTNNDDEVAPVTPSEEVAALEVAPAVVVFPNPATDMTNFVFTASENGKATIEIFDLAGARVGMIYASEVVEGTEYKTSYETSNMATGVYMYRLTNGGKVEMGRLIINK
jgi:hypothetical protein